jgi:hypothetical protein
MRWPVAVMLLAAPSVHADSGPRANRGYVTFGATLPYQKGLSGETDPQTYLSAPAGRTQGWLLGAGVSVGHAISLELELSATGVMRAREPYRYDLIYNLERRDRFLTVAARYHAGRPGAAISVEPVLGIVLASTRTWSQAEIYSHSNPGQLVMIDAKIQRDLSVRPGITGGFDLRFGTTHVAVVPSLRMLVTSRRDDIVPTYPSGFPVLTIRPGLALRAEF